MTSTVRRAADGAERRNGRVIRRHVQGYENKIWKKKDPDTGEWKTVRAGTEGAVPDSRVHRYARVRNFVLAPRDDADVQRNANIARAMRHLNEQTAHCSQNRIEAQADFECFVLRNGPSQYLDFLKKIQECFDTEGNLKTDREYPRVPFDPPTFSLVNSWVQYLRDDRDLSYGTIDGLFSGLSALNGQLAGTKISRTQLQDVLNKWKVDDEVEGRTKQAPAFDIVTDLIKIFMAVFSMTRCTDLDRVTMWATILVMLCVMGRASCMSDYSPRIEDIEFPRGEGAYDDDGLPNVIYIPWRNWKGRKKKIGEKYFIAIPRNYTNPRFCPVVWVMQLLSLRRKNGLPMEGKLFPHKNSVTLQRKLKRIFVAAGLPQCSSHSYRRTAAQWAARCGVKFKTCLDIGRWLDVNEARKYFGQGENEHRVAEREARDNKDPIFGVWRFASFVRSTPGGEFMRV